MSQFEYKKYGGKPTVYKYDPSKKVFQPHIGPWTKESWKQQTGFKDWGGITHQPTITIEQAMKNLGATFGPGIGVPQATQQATQQQIPTSTGTQRFFAWAQTPSGKIVSMSGEKESVLADIKQSGFILRDHQIGSFPAKPTVDTGLKFPVSGVAAGTAPLTSMPSPLRNIFLGGKEEETGKPIEYQQIPGATQEEINRAAIAKGINPANLQETAAGLRQIIEGETAKPPTDYTEAFKRLWAESGMAEKLGGIETALGGVKAAYEGLPSMADLLAQTRTARGLDEDTDRLNDLDIRLNEMETTIKNTEETIREQYKGSKITENQLKRLINAEISPIAGDYRDLLAERNTLATNLQRGETLAMQEATSQYGAAQMGIKGAEAQFAGLQDVYSLARLGLAPEWSAAQADMERKFKESDEGRKAIMDLMAEYPSAGIDLEVDTYSAAINKAALVAPGEIDKSLGLQTDAAGNVSVILQDQTTGDITTKSLGLIGKPQKAEGEKELITDAKLNTLAASGVPIDVAKVINQGFRDNYTEEEIINYLEMNGYGNAADLVRIYRDVMARVVGETIYE